MKEFVIELRCLPSTCNFRGFLEEALRNCLVCRMTSSSTQKKLLAKKNLTLQRAIDIAIAAEMAILDHQQEIVVSVQSEVHSEFHSVSYTKVCNACGKQGHTANRCRFCIMTCYKCGIQGHLQVVCKHTANQLDQVTEQKDEITIWTIAGGLAEGYQTQQQT